MQCWPLLLEQALKDFSMAVKVFASAAVLLMYLLG